MIRVVTGGPSGPAYEAWRKKVEAARDAAIAAWKAGRPLKLPELWGQLKVIFLDAVFHEKCAYCEGKHADGFPSDVEHYRPKKEVTDGRTAVAHPGYFWLAYEWWNLLLSCRHCNSPHRDKGLKHPGKSCEFRVRGGRVDRPGDDPAQWVKELLAERPLLLNPYFDDPAEHIAFDEHGMPYGKTLRGKETIKVCHLDRAQLFDARNELASSAIDIVIINMSKAAGAGTLKDGAWVPPNQKFSAWLNHMVTLRLRQMLEAQAGDS
jgi:hypothetical protein